MNNYKKYNQNRWSTDYIIQKTFCLRIIKLDVTRSAIENQSIGPRVNGQTGRKEIFSWNGYSPRKVLYYRNYLPLWIDNNYACEFSKKYFNTELLILNIVIYYHCLMLQQPRTGSRVTKRDA